MFKKTGLYVVKDYLSTAQCDSLLESIADFRKSHELPTIYRPEMERSLKYMVIDGETVHQYFPQLEQLYSDVNKLVREVCSLDLVPLSNRTATVNVNITPVTGEYRWHYDRNAVTAMLYLNEVAGGETEMYPNYRLYLGSKKHTRVQCWLDKLLRLSIILRRFGKKVTVTPRKGLLLVMRGDKCLHSVRPVRGQEERINVIMAFDTPGAVFPQQQNLDSYLYSLKSKPSFDPNYLK
jgi:hypothetical protein